MYFLAEDFSFVDLFFGALHLVGLLGNLGGVGLGAGDGSIGIIHAAFFLSSDFLELLILVDEISHVALGLCELHLIHTFVGVGVKESLPLVHDRELFTDALEQLHDASVVADEGDAHVLAARGDVAHGRLHVVRDPLHKEGAVPVLHLHHLFLDFLHGDFTTEHGGGGQVAATTRIGGGHHVVGSEHLTSKLSNVDGAVVHDVVSSKRGKAGEEEVQTREGHKVDSKLAQILVELARETEGASDTRHDLGNKTVEVAVAGGLHAEGTRADVVQGLVVDAVGLIAVIDELVHRESAVVGFHNSVRHLGAGDDREGGEDTVRILLLDLAEEQGAHTRASATTKTVRELEALKAFASLSLLADNVHHAVDESSTLGVMALGPAVGSTILTVDKVIRTINLAVGASAEGFKSARLKIKAHRTRDEPLAGGLVEVNIQTLAQLRVGSAVDTVRANAVLVAHSLPKASTNLITTLSCLNMYDFTHLPSEKKKRKKKPHNKNKKNQSNKKKTNKNEI